MLLEKAQSPVPGVFSRVGVVPFWNGMVVKGMLGAGVNLDVVGDLNLETSSIDADEIEIQE